MDQGQIDEILTAYQNLLAQLPGSRREFECRHCGYRSGELEWKCPSCRQWGTIDPIN
jgi:lipopolysaccharide biosynthesis regulator YciM